MVLAAGGGGGFEDDVVFEFLFLDFVVDFFLLLAGLGGCQYLAFPSYLRTSDLMSSKKGLMFSDLSVRLFVFAGSCWQTYHELASRRTRVPSLLLSSLRRSLSSLFRRTLYVHIGTSGQNRFGLLKKEGNNFGVARHAAEIVGVDQVLVDRFLFLRHRLYALQRLRFVGVGPCCFQRLVYLSGATKPRPEITYSNVPTNPPGVMSSSSASTSQAPSVSAIP